MIVLNKTYGLSWKALIEQIESYFQALFQSITDKDQQPTDINVIDLEQYSKNDNVEEEENEDDEQKEEVQEENGKLNEEAEDETNESSNKLEHQNKLQKGENNFQKEDEIQQQSDGNNTQSNKMNNSNHSSKSTDESVNQNEVEDINVLKEEQTNKNNKNNQQKTQTVTYIKKSDLINQNATNTQQKSNGVEYSQLQHTEQQQPKQQTNGEPAKLDHVIITIEDSDQEEVKNQNDLANDIQDLPYGNYLDNSIYFEDKLIKYYQNIDFDRITKYKRVESASNYSVLSIEISKFLLKKHISEFPTSDYELSSIISQSETSVVLQSFNHPQEFIKESYLILRRNFQSIPLKSKMNEEDFAKSDKFILQLIQSIEVNKVIQQNISILTQKNIFQGQYKGELLQSKDSVYESRIQECLNEYPLFEDRETFNQLKQFDNNRFSYGSLYYRSKKYLKYLISFAINYQWNLDDHLIIILAINQDDIIENLVELNKIFSKLKESVYKDEKLGYVTRNPKLSGSGLSIIYKIKEVKRSNIGLIVTQTDENSSIVTKYLEKENCVQIELHRLDQNNLHQFAQDCNNHLVQIKISDSSNQLLTENCNLLRNRIVQIKFLINLFQNQELTMMDCFDQNGLIIAPEKECYTYYKDVYERYLKNFNLIETPLKLTYSPDLLKFNEISKDIKVYYEIRRNFEQFNFTKYMTYKEVDTLKQYFEKQFSKTQNFHLKEKEESHSYKTQTYTHNNKYFLVEIMKSDHVGIVSFGKLKELQKSLTETFELLQKFQSDRYTFLRDENLGYLSETGQRLGDNFYLKLDLTVNPEELELIQKLAKSHQYQLSLKNSGSLHKSNNYNNNIELELKRCGYFLYEVEFIIKLIYTLADKKEQRK